MIESLRSTFSGRLIFDAAEMAPFLTDWRGKWTGTALAVVQPDTTADVASVVKWCAAHNVPIVPQGGNTSMSGSATPDTRGNALVLSLTRLNRIRATDPTNNTMTVEAGCVLQNLQEHARGHNRLFPLSLAAQGSCTIGGNLATNAGGVQVLQYGNARELCLGLEVVTPQGEVWDGLRGLRKDNSGYDLRDLYIGAEGTLGIITAASLKLFPLPVAQINAWMNLDSLDAALKLLDLARARLGATLTAFEVMNANCWDLLHEHCPDLKPALGERSPWSVLIEVSELISQDAASAGLQALLEAALESELISDATISQNGTQFRDFWSLREHMSEAQSRAGKNIKHDISVPISKIPKFVASTDLAITKSYPEARMVVFGHLGDGNLHYNVSPHKGERGDTLPTLEAAINRITHDAVAAHAGSISAEHGLGSLRRVEAARYKSSTELRLMRAIKEALDPQGLMNPGKGLPL